LEETYQHIKTVVDSQDHTTPDESRARAVAEQLAKNIQAHLASA
jgi:hypothetical protein